MVDINDKRGLCDSHRTYLEQCSGALWFLDDVMRNRLAVDAGNSGIRPKDGGEYAVSNALPPGDAFSKRLHIGCLCLDFPYAEYRADTDAERLRVRVGAGALVWMGYHRVWHMRRMRHHDGRSSGLA